MSTLRKHIALLFLAVYLTATAGASLTAITCTCVAQHRHAAESGQVCEHGHGGPCTHAHPTATAEPCAELSVAAPCCCHLHINIEWLLVRCCDGERCRQHQAYQLLANELPVALLAEQADPQTDAPLQLLRARRAAPPVPHPSAGCADACGLRAPPVTV